MENELKQRKSVNLQKSGSNDQIETNNQKKNNNIDIGKIAQKFFKNVNLVVLKAKIKKLF